MLGVAVKAGTREDAVREVLLELVPRSHRLAYWMLHDADAAADAVQEAALVAWRRRATLRDPNAAEAWFNRILTNVCLSEIRRRSRPAPIVDQPVVDDERESIARQDELARCLGSLTGEEQAVLALRFGRDLTVSQIAVTIGIREGTVKSRLHSALAHLRAAIEAERRREREA
jgi:RNA polymerase sigma-70 factor (ECF subfamily)